MSDVKVTRKSSPAVKVYCLPEEKEILVTNADATGLPLSTYLLRVGIGYRVTGVLDLRQVGELSKVSADLGRLGGLLKLWLADDERTRGMSPAMLRALLKKLEESQKELHEIIDMVVKRG